MTPPLPTPAPDTPPTGPGVIRRRFLTLVMLGLGVAGCQSPAPVGGSASIKPTDEWLQLALASREHSLPMPEDSPAMPSTATPKLPAPPAAPPLPSLAVEEFTQTRDVDLAVILRALASLADVNLVLGEAVKGPVRLNLAATRWDQLFTALVTTHGLHHEWDGEVLRVMAEGDVQRRIALETLLRDQLRAELERAGASPPVTALYRVRYADTTKLAASLRASLEQRDEKSLWSAPVIHPDPDSGLLILQAVPTQLARLQQLAEALDQPARQVLIEAIIVQANRETARDLGFQWGLLQTGLNRDRLTLGTTPQPGGFAFNFPAAIEEGGSGLVLGLERLTNSQTLTAQLSALQRDGRLNIVSAPSITTLDKQTAVIESGEERPFRSAQGSGVGAVSTVDFKKALLRLEVLPQVIDDRWIKLQIATSKDEFDDSKVIRIDGSDQVPILTRSATTTLYLAHGQTTVIGGLSTQAQTDGSTGVPGAKDVPLFGGLFRAQTQRTSLSETLIFITPHLLPGGTPAPTHP